MRERLCRSRVALLGGLELTNEFDGFLYVVVRLLIDDLELWSCVGLHGSFVGLLVECECCFKGCFDFFGHVVGSIGLMSLVGSVSYRF